VVPEVIIALVIGIGAVCVLVPLLLQNERISFNAVAERLIFALIIMKDLLRISLASSIWYMLNRCEVGRAEVTNVC
jgi:hypothetical protein